MTFIYSLFGTPLGWAFKLLFTLIQNYGITLLVFTVLIKIATFPLGLRQQKTTAQMGRINPKIKELQEKYKNNPQKLQEEQAALYERENIKVSAGCLPSILQFLILFGLIDVVYKPLTHVLSLSKEIIEQGSAIMTEIGVKAAGYTAELTLLREVQSNPSVFSSMGAEAVGSIQGLSVNFLWWDLSQTPTWAFNALIWIPIFSFITSILMTVVSLMMQKESLAGNKSMMSTMLIMPVFSLIFAFQVPAGVGLYWGISNLLGIGQSLLLQRMISPQKLEQELQEKKAEEQKQMKQERTERQEVVREDGTKEQVERVLSEKEINRRRLAEARRRDAEKYGETYVEVDDQDLV